MLKKVKHANYVIILTMSVLFCSVCVAKDTSTFDRYLEPLRRPQNVQSVRSGMLFTDLHNICLNNTDANLIFPGLLNTLPHLNTQTKGYYKTIDRLTAIKVNNRSYCQHGSSRFCI